MLLAVYFAHSYPYVSFNSELDRGPAGGRTIEVNDEFSLISFESVAIAVHYPSISLSIMVPSKYPALASTLAD